MVANDVILELRNRINKVISLLRECNTEKTALKDRLKEFEITLKKKEKELDKLRNKYETLKLAKSISGLKPENHEAKGKINMIIRDLDRCIGLLNR